MLVDRWSAGDPDRAGRAYAVNVLGCIVGPLVSGFFLMPWVGEHVSMLLFAAPWFAMAVMARHEKREVRARATRHRTRLHRTCSCDIFFDSRDFESQFPQREVLRDIDRHRDRHRHRTCTKQTYGEWHRDDIVDSDNENDGAPDSRLSGPITRRNTLVICFGMGTTHRSAASWGIQVTAVELVPKCSKAFHLLPCGCRESSGIAAVRNVVIDDGRRFLERSPKNTTLSLLIRHRRSRQPDPACFTRRISMLWLKDVFRQTGSCNSGSPGATTRSDRP